KSMRYSRTDLAHLYGRMLSEDEYAVDVTFDLELSLDEMVYLTGKKTVTKDIQRIHDLAQARRHSLGRDDGKPFFEKKPRKQTPDKKQMDLTQIINSAPQEDKIEKKESENVPPVKKSASKAKPQKTLFDF
ncbi:replication factor C large subunit, partial [Methanococcoides sp. SA1]|nr:replication factor C large subunit [Methanococcoides sp. SA1]